MSRGRPAKLRTLNRFSVRRTHPYVTTDGKVDWNRPVYVVRPRDFYTVIAKIEAVPGTSPGDISELMDAVSALCDQPAPEPRQ